MRAIGDRRRSHWPNFVAGPAGGGVGRRSSADVSVTRPVFASVLSLLLIAFGPVAFFGPVAVA